MGQKVTMPASIYALLDRDTAITWMKGSRQIAARSTRTVMFTV